MYIKSLIIDGFKSYGRRTEVHGFDAEFTAITGLNGTGKSNILDSICFVLGIMNLGQVRATSLQDLVYKSGQAGVTKATVTLIFDNTNPNQCPLGYEKCREITVTRQIVVGGKNKYLINGKLVQNKKISDLFCSVQLNVNNPNFIIMQGRITKVLNMKPHEILSMIEETAGTSMYESKRDASMKLIERKDNTVRETNTLLEEEIHPKLEKLKREHAAYLEFQKLCRDVEHLTRINVSYRYLKYKEAIKHNQENVDKIIAKLEKAKETISNNEKETETIEEQVKVLLTNIDESSGGELKETEKLLKQEQLKEVEAESNLKSNNLKIEQINKKLENSESNRLDSEKLLQNKETEISKVNELFDSLKSAMEMDARAYEQAQKDYEAMSRGLMASNSNDAGETGGSLQDQLIGAKASLSEAQTNLKTWNMELKHLKQTLKQKENTVRVQDSAQQKNQQQYEKLKMDVKRLQQQQSRFDYEDGAFESLKDRKDSLNAEMQQIQRQLDQRNASRYQLHYRDPEPGFDRSRVRGMVGKLFKVRDEKFCFALLMAGGGSIYSYVTDDDVTSKKILQRGQLQNRVTIIPINKITSQPIDSRVVQMAKDLVGKDNVHSAFELLDYDRYYEPVMNFVFGHTLICRDLNVAKQISYNRNIRCRTVTLEGDVVDPEGCLSGGTRPKGSNILQELAEINRLETHLNQLRKTLREIDGRLPSLQEKAQKYREWKQALELKEYELNACEESLNSGMNQQEQELNDIREQIQQLETDIGKSQELENNAQKRIKDIEEKLLDSKGYRERELKKATENMNRAKLKSEKSQENWKKHEQNYRTQSLEIETIKKEIETIHDQQRKMNEEIDNLNVKRNELQDIHENAKKKIHELREQIQSKKRQIDQKNKELQQLYKRRENCEKTVQDLQLDIKRKEHEMKKEQTTCKDIEKKIQDLEKKYNWLQEEEQFFGIKNTRYDYSKDDPIAAGQKLVAMRERMEKMERNVNMRAMTLLEREEEKYQDTLRRKKIVEEDKEKIEDIIYKMDEKKRDEVEKAWYAVNENFSSIFSTLLQGAEARLSAVKQNNILTGLEIKVGFNGVWKESLGELSGGQRSLVALSLVLAMLKFSPAPLYILDEVDAALDMSHTQNIGSMLKAHFTNSQFIIVSLKDGMFNNANVLFRTKFEEGVSAVTRTVNPLLRNRK